MDGPGLLPAVGDISAIPQDLMNFAELVFDNPLSGGILQAVQNLAEFLNNNFDNLPFLGTEIPVINKSLADLLDILCSP